MVARGKDRKIKKKFKKYSPDRLQEITEEFDQPDKNNFIIENSEIEVNNETSLAEYFNTSPFNDIEAAKEERGRNEIAGEYQILSERYKSLNDDFDETEDFAKMAVQRIGTCSGLSNKLEETNEEETKLLSGLQDLIEDLLFRLETVNHVGNKDNEEGIHSSDDEDKYDEDVAQKEIMALFEDCSTYKTSVQKKINSCNAKVSKVKMDVSELVQSNPRARRMSKGMAMLRFTALEKTTLPTVPHGRSILPVEQEEFHPSKESSQYVEAIRKFIKDQELPVDEEQPTLNKLQVISKMVDHFKNELKTANAKSTEDNIKLNNLQRKLPKLEESRVRLSQQCDTFRDEIEEKNTLISKLKIKVNTLETMSNKSIDTVGSSANEKTSPAKQAVIPKSVLKEIMQASEKEVEAKMQAMAASNEAVRVVLVRKNKQIRRLDGTIILQLTEIRSLKQKIAELQDSIVAGTTDVEAIKGEAEVREATKGPSPESQLSEQAATPLLPSESSLISQSIIGVESIADSAVINFDVITVDVSTNTEIELEEEGTQTEEDTLRPGSPDIEKITFKMDPKRRRTRKGSIALVAEAAIRRASIRRPTEGPIRRSSMANQDMFGVGAAHHQLTSADLADLEKFAKDDNVNEKNVRQTEDIALLQKYIASMREQSEKSMEKVREFIAKEKIRNEATTRRLINEHEKVLSVHKKELNKVVFSINRFKETVTEVLNGKDITQIVVLSKFKFEQSPLQLRIQSTELLSSLEFEIFQALKEKDIQIRDLSGRKRLDDRDLDRRIKEREKTVFSMLDHTNERLKKEKERVNMREQWVNEKIKTELEYEKTQEFEVQTIEKALARFWKENCDTISSQRSTVSPPPPDTTPRSEGIPATPTHKSRDSSEAEQVKTTPFTLGFEATLPKLHISVPDQRSNLEYLDMGHRAGLVSNITHKLITNIINRWSELIEQKTGAIFRAYVKYRRYNALQTDLMNEESTEVDLNRAMILHRKVRDALDLQYKRLHVQLGKLTTYCDNMLEEEEQFFDTLQDPRLSKNLVRPNMLHINHSAMLKKIKDLAPLQQTLHVHFPVVTSEEPSSPLGRLEDIPLLKQVAIDRPSGKWKPAQNGELPVQPLLIPKIMQLDTSRMAPVVLGKQPTQTSKALRKFVSGLPPIPLCGGMKHVRISYIPNVCSVYSEEDRKNSGDSLH